MLLADALSRLPSSENTPIYLDLCIEHHAFTTERIQQIGTATQEDPILGPVYQFTLDGWPDRRNRVPRIARRYWDQRDELSIDHGLLMKGPRIIIPSAQRERTLANLHVGHQGILAMQQMLFLFPADPWPFPLLFPFSSTRFVTLWFPFPTVLFRFHHHRHRHHHHHHCPILLPLQFSAVFFPSFLCDLWPS